MPRSSLFQSIATFRSFGDISFSNERRLVVSVAATSEIPVILPPGCARLSISLAHPGGNITGISDVAATLTTKRLSLLKEMSPKLRKVAMLWNKDDLGMTLRYEASAKAAHAIGITVQPLGVREPDDFNEAFTVMDREPPDAIL